MLAQPNFTAVKRYALARLAHIAPTYRLVLLLTLMFQLGTDVVVSLGGDKHAAGKTGGFIANLLTPPALGACRAFPAIPVVCQLGQWRQLKRVPTA